jgi:K+-transporting ATPase KdpF subunit
MRAFSRAVVASRVAWIFTRSWTDVRPRCDRNRCGVLRGDLRDPVRDGADLMTAADVFGLTISILVFVYLCYALFRGEKL